MNPNVSSSSTNNRRKTISVSGPAKYDQTRKRIERMEEERNERRRETEQKKAARKVEQAKLLAAGNPGDVDFIGMVQEWRDEQAKMHNNHKQPHYGPGSTDNHGNIIVAVRKRPMSNKEIQKKDHDSISCFHPKIWVHSAKFKVDGITKYLTHTGFQFDHAFGEDSTTDEIYMATTMPLLDHVVSTQGRATCFCYGMTGSGKTYTMSAIQQILAHDLYEELKEQGIQVEVTLAFFELYGGFVQDLLHDRKRCKLLEDGKGEVNITGLQEVPARSAEDFLRIVSAGHSQRTTHTTEANDSSSRSHAICQVFLRDPSNGDLKGKLTLVDLAGSERGSDTKSHNSLRRAESAEINTSLLSLKECIRALGQKNTHVPYRGSKLTLILKDCFSPDSKTTMIATVSPGASATDHSLNTLRYADRIKEQRISSSSNKRSTRGPASRTCTSSGPSRQRISRILSALKWNPNSSENQFDIQKATRVEEDADEKYIAESVSTLSGEISDLDDDEGTERPIKETKPTEREESEALRAARELFDVEEELRDEHFACLQDMAEMLQEEFKMIQDMEAMAQASDDAMDNYAIKLAEYLDRKELLIRSVQAKFDIVKHHREMNQSFTRDMEAFVQT
ncbi:diatom spindle kinesin 1 [Nitzschia inconspicua]|uniref:Kinesin-like protein n=1 Tax=Nitzschia inconspicua TaxID=303405 RepID=A0A9K3LW66_9STRA|nr:diatom spindle kinesin 1 [Nitzschia inconspicua]